MHPSPLLAIVEDAPELRTDLIEFLDLKGFTVQGFESGEAFLQAWPAMPFSLLLLDIVLPGLSGFEVAQRVRAQDADIGILMLTALDGSQDQVRGLMLGADVYLSKRSTLDMIEAACHSLLRRITLSGSSAAPLIPQTVGEQPWRLHIAHWELLAPNGARMKLTHTEVSLLAALFEQPGQTLSRDSLLAQMRKPESLASLRNLDNTASRLRRKVHAACHCDLPLRSGYGKGYSFVGQCCLNQ